jgi:hypothetical protein
MSDSSCNELDFPYPSAGDVECCFCGKTITANPPDPCALDLSTNFGRDREKRDAASQEMFCHATCLKVRLRPNFPLLPEIP